MKKINYFCLLFGVLVSVVLFSSCSKDDDESSSNSIIGTWYTEAYSYEEITYNSDGTCTYRRYKLETPIRVHTKLKVTS